MSAVPGRTNSGNLLVLLALAAGAVAAPLPAFAGAAWDEIKASVYGTRAIHDGRGLITLRAPGRPEDQKAVPVGITAGFADGRSVRTLTLIVDENPSPVAAVFRFGEGRDRVSLGTNLRLNAQTDVRVVVEADDGQLYMVEQLVKFAGGQGACAAPPTGDPAEVLASMGKVKLAELPDTGPNAGKASSVNRRVKLDIRHPNYTGMQMDQITLLFVPLRIVNRLEVKQGSETVFAMDGSITLSEDPTLEFDYKSNGAGALQVTVKDTSGAEWDKTIPVGPSS